ncbi:hypothetical protein D3C81_2166670 [compost metagenome]
MIGQLAGKGAGEQHAYPLRNKEQAGCKDTLAADLLVEHGQQQHAAVGGQA